MDRRTLLYILGLTFIFFIINQIFDFGVGAPGQNLIEEPATEIVITGKQQNPKVIPPSDYKKFGITSLYSDVALRDFATHAFEVDENYLTLSWNDNPPNWLYTPSLQDKVSSSRRIDLRVDSQGDNTPILYSLFPLAKMILPWVPDDGSLKVHLVYFEAGRAYVIEAETVGAEKLLVGMAPPQNAIAILETAGDFGPYGFFDAKEQKLRYLDHMADFENYTLLTYPKKEELDQEFKEQEYFVLENDYQQLVFTNLNAALVEINLPFISETNPNSVVKETDFDRTIQKNYSLNDRFPQHPYYAYGETGKRKDPKVGGYYPLLRRDIQGIAGSTTTRINPHYYSLNIFQERGIPDPNIYKVTRFEKDLIEFQETMANRKITKTYSLPKNPNDSPYVIDLEIKIEGDARNLNLVTGIPEVELISGSFNPALKYRGGAKVKEIKAPKELVEFSYAQPNWVSNGNGFFGIIIDPLSKEGQGFAAHPVSGELTPTRLSIIDAQYNRFPISKYPGYAMHLPLISKPATSKFRIFAGPYDKKILERVDQTYSDLYTGYNPDYSAAQSYHGWFAFVSHPFAKFLFFLLDFFHTITHSWGFSIILLTIALRLMLYPLTAWSMKSTIKMQKVAPLLKEIQEKYKKDPKRVQMETMNLYRREGANPFGGCLPMIIQLPFLFGMFDLLKSSFALRGASFIPGWIDNLTAPDVVFSWKYPLPFLGNSFHLLPIILGVIMYFQQKMMSPTASNTASDDQQKQMRSVGKIMPFLFIFLFYKFPSGLNIYWISSTLLGILQQWWTSKRMLAKGK